MLVQPPVASHSRTRQGIVDLQTFLPSDIYEHGFEDDTGGAFNDGAGGSILVSGGGQWNIDTDAAREHKSVTTDVSVSAGNILKPIYKTALPASAAKGFYTRFALKQNASYSNTDAHKVDRVQGDINGNWGTFLISDGSGFTYFWDDLLSTESLTPNVNTPAPTPDSLRGAWHWYEVFRDISNMDNIIVKVWIDNVLYFDYARVAGSPEPTLNYDRVVWFGVINSMDIQSTLWMDQIGISTHRMGIP